MTQSSHGDAREKLRASEAAQRQAAETQAALLNALPALSGGRGLRDD